jgi:hypothetical protein
MRRNSGEVVTGLLIGLAVGALIAFVRAGNYAQVRANQTGQDVSVFAYFQEQPGEASVVVISPALAGAAIGWVMDEVTDDSKSSPSSQGSTANVNVTGENNVVNIRGDESNANRTDSRTSY